MFKFFTPPAAPKPLGGLPTTFTVEDSRGDLADADGSAARMLAGLAWRPETFEVTMASDAGLIRKPGEPDATLRFRSPSPPSRAKAEPVVDSVALDVFAARDRATGQVKDAPAFLILDILQGGNIVSNFIGRAMARRGIHGFVMHMPFNGKRQREGQAGYDWREFLPSLHQAVTDARRCRDVIAAMPFVRGPIGIQGTSLGGFIATVTAAMDNAFDPVVITLAGVDIYRVLTTGKIDAAMVHRRLCEVGHDDFTLRRSLWRTEPMRVAHRLDPDRTWLMTARRDQVVARYSSDLLARTASIHPDRQLRFAGCHYTCAMATPWIIASIAQAMGDAVERADLGDTKPVRRSKTRFAFVPDWAIDLEPAGV